MKDKSLVVGLVKEFFRDVYELSIEQLKNKYPLFSDTVGLCMNLDTINFKQGGVEFAVFAFMANEVVNWKHYSGNNRFPVKPINGLTPRACYSKHLNEGTLYKGEYGKLRKELACFLAGLEDEKYFVFCKESNIL